MSTVDWDRLRAVFHQVVDQPPDARQAYLLATCGDEPALYEEACDLLRSLGDAETFLEAPLAKLTPPEDDPLLSASGELGSRRVGPYALEQYLGHGGMGAVFLASRADEAYHQQVAVKVVRPDLVTDELVERFRSERQILADLRHPHIAQLLDGGTTADGRPYLVMEYVEGKPIDRYCDERSLDLDDRLQLFVKVCRAVHVAHQNLIVHRDLKPANLMVTGDGEPKLLDFGVAKLLPAEGSVERYGVPVGGATQGAAPMTLDYASPEQILHLPITTASDVYALGVVLCELLSGHRPLRMLGASPEELVEAAKSRVPPRCSALAVEGDAATVANLRGSSVLRLRRRLEGDLDTVIAKALSKDPRRRYASAEDLAQDLERHARGLPVAARPDTIVYRAGKFLRRHRWPAAAACSGLVALLVFVAMLLLQRDEILKQKARSEATSEFLVSLFDLSNPESFHANPELLELYPEHLRGQDVTARQLLDVGARQLAERLEGKLEVQSEMMSTMGWAYFHLGAYGRAREQLEQAIAIARARDGAQSLTVAAISVRLAAVHREQARFGHARRLLDRARDIANRTASGDTVNAEVLTGLAQLAARQGRFDEAEGHLTEALEQARSLYGARHPRVAASLAVMGDLARERGWSAVGQGHYEEALAIYQEVYGDRHPRLAALHHDLGLVQVERGHFREAEASYERALTMQREIHGDRHPSIATTLHGLARLHYSERQYDEAMALAQEALALRRDIFGAEHPAVGLNLNLMGLIHGGQRRFDEAETFYRRALEVWRPFMDSEHVWIASAHNNLASALSAQQRFEESEAHYQQALAIYRTVYRRPHFQVATVLNNLGALARGRGQHDLAETRYREALAIQRQVLDADHPDLLTTLHNMAVVLLAAGRPAEAEPLAREAAQTFAAKVGPDNASTGTLRLTLGRVLRDLGRIEEAETELRAARAIFQATLPADHPWHAVVADSLEKLAEVVRGKA